MCGIAGCVVSAPDVVKPDWLAAMSSSLRHRGPDDSGYLQWSSGEGVTPSFDIQPRAAQVGLVHQRLSIIDVSRAGWQPMLSTDGRYTLIFNGEIYNFVELRKELEKLGHTFRGHSDSEVLLAALVQWGTAALGRLVGMFALGLLDSRARTLTLARDFFGIKPLYYSQWSNGFAFASEIKALLELPQVGRKADPRLLNDYLRHGLVEHDEQTMFADVRQVPPASVLVVSLATPGAPATTETFWSPGPRGRSEASFDEAAEALRHLFVESVQLHLRSDVPVGTALSGGIDSSAIVAAVRSIGGEALDIRTFSYLSPDPATNEERWIDIAAAAAHTEVHKVSPPALDLVRDLDHLIRVQDQPFGSTSIYSQYRVFQLAAESGVKVMLDGQGADELMAGYWPYLSVRIASLLRKGQVVAALRLAQHAATLPDADTRTVMFAKGIAGFLPGPAQSALRARRSGGSNWLREEWLAAHDLSPARVSSSGTSLIDTLRAEVTTTSLPALLRYEDRNSMAFSIESRVPFLTPALADLLLSLPEHYLISPTGTTKSVFRAAMRGLVPDSILDRRDKIGFSTPGRDWWLSNLGPWVEDVFDKADPDVVPAIDVAAARFEWGETVAGRRTSGWHVWRCINVIRWAEAYAVDVA